MLVTKYVQLDTNEVINRIQEVAVLSPEDKKLSTARPNEPFYEQRIRNIISHMKKGQQTKNIYNYQIKKGTGKNNTVTFTLLTGKGNNVKPISYTKVKSIQKKNSFTPRKINWNVINKNKSILGNSGDEFVFKHELKNHPDPLDAKRIQHTSKYLGDGAGYDIESIDQNGDTLYIEVKTTTKKVNMNLNQRDTKLIINKINGCLQT